MNIYDFADTMELEFVIKRRVNWKDINTQWFAHFESVDIKDGSLRCGIHGNGATPEQAIRDYLEKIRGQRVVHHDWDVANRREFVVPERITII